MLDLDITLEDKFTREEGQIYLSGCQALVRLALEQQREDQRKLNKGLRLLLPERLIDLCAHFYISRSLKSTPNSFLRRTVRVFVDRCANYPLGRT